MKIIFKISIIFSILMVFISCDRSHSKVNDNMSLKESELKAQDILGNPNFQAISYGGYRKNSRNIQPTIEELKEDMKILSAMGIKIVRTYNVHFPHAGNVLEAISQLKKENSNFEMYVMLGAWIDCENAWTANPNHEGENEPANAKEISNAVELALKYEDIVKVIAVGNEAMVKWAASYFVQPKVILKWVNHLQKLKAEGKLSKDLWITSSDNFASWGGGDEEYHTEDLEKLIRVVDFVSMHTYPMHDTHYNPAFWGLSDGNTELSKEEKILKAMEDARDYAVSQYESVSKYIKNLGIDKPIHIGETGWASSDNGLYGEKGSKANDEYKEALYHNLIREWTNSKKMACFYFEAFDEDWKDAQNPGGSENHFGLLTIDGKAKYALWNLVDQGVFDGLTRGEQPIVKTFEGNKEKLLEEVLIPDIKKKEMAK